EYRPHRFADFSRQARDMKQVRLIEPHHFAGRWVAGNSLTSLPGAQSIIRQPLELNSRGRAELLDLVPACRLKNFLPRQIESTAVVAYIHHAFSLETVANRRRDTLIDATAVGNRRFTARVGALQTEKPDFQRPVMRVSVFVVKRNGLVWRVLSRCIDPAADHSARCRAITIIQQRSRNSLNQRFELFRAIDPKSAEKDPTR